MGEADRADLGLGATGAASPVGARHREMIVPLLGKPHMSVDPGLDTADQDQRVVVDDPQVGRHHFLAGDAGLHADIEVVAVQDTTDRLVEAEVLDRPRREGHDEAVDRVHLAGLRIGGDLLGVPGEGRDLAAAELLEPVRERGPGHRAFPPGDTANVESPGAADEGNRRIAQRGADLRQEVGIDDLGVLMNDHDALEVSSVPRHLLGLLE